MKSSQVLLKKYKKVLINSSQILLKAEIEFSQEQRSTEKYRSISLKFCYSEQKKISIRNKEVQKSADQFLSSFAKNKNRFQPGTKRYRKVLIDFTQVLLKAEKDFSQEQSISSKSG